MSQQLHRIFELTTKCCEQAAAPSFLIIDWFFVTIWSSSEWLTKDIQSATEMIRTWKPLFFQNSPLSLFLSKLRINYTVNKQTIAKKAESCQQTILESNPNVKDDIIRKWHSLFAMMLELQVDIKSFFQISALLPSLPNN